MVVGGRPHERNHHSNHARRYRHEANRWRPHKRRGNHAHGRPGNPMRRLWRGRESGERRRAGRRTLRRTDHELTARRGHLASREGS